MLLGSLLAAGALWQGSLDGQVPARAPLPAPAAATNTVPPGAEPEEIKSPVETFRELLAMTPARRNEALADRPAELRRRMLAKVREYESLPADRRELRLRVTELRWYLWPLLKTPATNRVEMLARVPADYHKLIEDRLQHWDKLRPATQEELLKNEATLRYLTEQAESTAEQRSNLVKNLSPERRKKLEAGIQQIQQMPVAQRQKMIARFDQFFELNPSESDKALSTLSEPERRQIQRTLRIFQRLPPELRDQCIQSFEKFVKMDLAERQQFLKNAERWKLMSPEEREDWRQLVTMLSVQPPLPPGVGPPPLPPEPDL